MYPSSRSLSLPHAYFVIPIHDYPPMEITFIDDGISYRWRARCTARCTQRHINSFREDAGERRSSGGCETREYKGGNAVACCGYNGALALGERASVIFLTQRVDGQRVRACIHASVGVCVYNTRKLGTARNAITVAVLNYIIQINFTAR